MGQSPWTARDPLVALPLAITQLSIAWLRRRRFVGRPILAAAAFPGGSLPLYGCLSVSWTLRSVQSLKPHRAGFPGSDYSRQTRFPTSDTRKTIGRIKALRGARATSIVTIMLSKNTPITAASPYTHHGARTISAAG